MQLENSSGTQRSGTGSQMNRGLGGGLVRSSCSLRARILVTRSIHLVGEEMRWKDLERRSDGVRAV